MKPQKLKAMKKIKILTVLFVSGLLFAIPQAKAQRGAYANGECIAVTMPKQDLNAKEKQEMLFMREEEKLAHDVYTVLYDKWGARVFNNISKSEAEHTQRMKEMIDKYGLTDPAKTGTGQFTNKDLQKLYNDLVAKGSQSLKDALIVGCTIEDKDIADLDKAISETNNDDLRLVYKNIQRASYNHMRAFSRVLKRWYDVDYTPQFISKSRYDEIMAYSPKKKRN